MDIDPTDAQLVRRTGSRSDREAEAELFRRMAPRIRLYGLTSYQKNACDVFQCLIEGSWIVEIDEARRS